ncbi:MAG: hypothetical protein MUO30_14985 [Anaerolineales bacterium]|nr:hypothetical protein [Anaerolineales bacterium]
MTGQHAHFWMRGGESLQARHVRPDYRPVNPIWQNVELDVGRQGVSAVEEPAATRETSRRN